MKTRRARHERDSGVASLSVLDGWWIEGRIEGVTGWAIGEDARTGGSIMKTKGKVLAAAVIIGFTVGAAGSSFAFGGWPYPGHKMRPDLEEQQAVSAAADKATAAKKAEGAVKEESGTQSSTEKAAVVKVAPEAPKGN